MFLRFAILVFAVSCARAQESGPVPREIRLDRNGYPLPVGAVARLGLPPAMMGFSQSMTWTADGKQFVAADEKNVTFFDAATGRWVKSVASTNDDNFTSRIFLRHSGALLKLNRNQGTLSDPATGEDLVHFEFPSPLGDSGRKLYSIDGSADSRFLAGIAASGSSAGVAWRYDLAGNRYSRLIADRADLQSLQLSPDARQVFATGGVAEPELTARDIASSKELWTVPLKGVGRVRAISADGKRLAVTDLAGLSVFDTSTGKLVMSSSLESTSPASTWGIDLSADGSQVALADGGRVIVWGTHDGKIRHRLPHAARLVAFSPDGKTLLSGSGWIQKWDMQTGKELLAKPMLAKPLGAFHLNWSADGERLLAVWQNHRPGSDSPNENLLGVWAIPQKKHIWSEAVEEMVVSAHLDRRGKQVRVLLNNALVRGWNTTPPDEPIVAHTAMAGLGRNRAEQTFLPDGRLVIQSHSSNGGAMELYDANGKFVLRRAQAWPDHSPRIKSANLFRGKGSTLIGPGGWRYELVIDRKLPALQVGTSARFISLLSNDATTFVAGRAIDGSTISSHVWESLTGGIVSNLPSEIPNFDRAALSPDGQYLAMLTERDVRIQSLRNPSRSWNIPAEGATAVAFSPNGHTLATAMRDGTILMWKTQRVREEWRLEDIDGQWKTLSLDAPAPAWQVLWHFRDHPAKALEILNARMKPFQGANDTALWIARLDDPKYAVRERASKTLAGREDDIVIDLRKALQVSRSEEQRTRIERLLERVDAAVPPTGDSLRALRCIWLLEQIGTPEAHRLLERMGAGSAGSRVTIEAREAYARRFR